MRNRFPAVNITMDGGINNHSIESAVSKGQIDFVAGSYLFSLKDIKSGITNLRNIAEINYNHTHINYF